MFSRWKRRTRRVVLAGTIIVLVVVWAWSPWDRRPPDIRECAAVRGAGRWRHPRSARRRRSVSRVVGSKSAGSIQGTVGGFSALLAAAAVPDTSAGREAQQGFARQLETADIGLLAQAFEWNPGGWKAWRNSPRPFSPARGDPWTTPGRAGCSRPFARSQSHGHGTAGGAAALHRGRRPDRGQIRR